MRNKKLLVGATLATAAALIFAVAPATSIAASAGVKCYGINGCKGKSACKSANNSCKGLNNCKGQGFIMESSTDACNNAGGTTSAS